MILLFWMVKQYKQEGFYQQHLIWSKNSSSFTTKGRIQYNKTEICIVSKQIFKLV